MRVPLGLNVMDIGKAGHVGMAVVTANAGKHCQHRDMSGGTALNNAVLSIQYASNLDYPETYKSAADAVWAFVTVMVQLERMKRCSGKAGPLEKKKKKKIHMFICLLVFVVQNLKRAIMTR